MQWRRPVGLSTGGGRGSERDWTLSSFSSLNLPAPFSLHRWVSIYLPTSLADRSVGLCLYIYLRTILNVVYSLPLLTSFLPPSIYIHYTSLHTNSLQSIFMYFPTFQHLLICGCYIQGGAQNFVPPPCITPSPCHTSICLQYRYDINSPSIKILLYYYGLIRNK